MEDKQKSFKETILLPYMKNTNFLTFESPTTTPVSPSAELILQYFNASTTNQSVPKSDQPPTKDAESLTTICLVLILMAIIIGTIIGNILVCVAVCLVRKLRKPYNYLIVSLAVSDLCVAILVMPMALLHASLGEWQFGKRVCDIWVSFDVLSCTASILNLCMISVDRYLAITKPLEYGVKRTPKRMIEYIAFVWLGAAFVSVPPVLILGNEHGDGSICQVCQNFWYQIYATFGSFYIPLSVMVTVYYKIFQAAKRIVDEERKAQAHLKIVQEQDKLLNANSCNNSKHSSRIIKAIEPPNSPGINSRRSIVLINNGEVETKLASDVSIPGIPSSREWISTTPDVFRQQNLHNNISQFIPTPESHQVHKYRRKSSENQLLEVPLNPDNASPVSTSTTCETWSLYHAKEELVSPVLLPQRDVVVSTSVEEKHIERNRRDATEDAIVSPKRDSISESYNTDTVGELITFNDNDDDTELEIGSGEQLNRRLWTQAKNNVAIIKTHFKKTVAVVTSESSFSGVNLKKNDSNGDGRKKNSAANSPIRKKAHPSKSKLRITLAKERKASTTLGIIMSAFIVCWLPFFVLALVRPFLGSPTDIPDSVSSLFLWLGYANSLFNPIIYATLNKDFRKPFQEILCLRCSNLNILMREEFYHSQYGPDTPTHSHVRSSAPHQDFGDDNTLDPKMYSWQQTLVSESRF